MKKYLALGSVGLMATGTAFAASAAQAVAPADCGTHEGATKIELIGTNICSIVYSTAGNYTFTAPAGVTKLQALVIGAGATGYQSGDGYAGGGGAVKFVDGLNATSALSLLVGAGGTGSPIYDVGITNADEMNGGLSQVGDVQAAGGKFSDTEGDPATTDSGKSGSGNNGFGIEDGYGYFYPMWGGGAKTAAALGAPGDGYLSSDAELTGGSVLFPAVDGELELGRGGTVGSVLQTQVSAPTGSDVQLNGDSPTLPVQSMGWGGSTAGTETQSGADGGVIFRFLAPALAVTGSAVSATVNSLLAAGLVLAGALGLTFTIRRSRKSN